MVPLFLLCLALLAASTTAQVVGVDNRRDITVTSQRNTTLIINGQEVRILRVTPDLLPFCVSMQVPASIPLTFSGCRYVYRFQETDPSCQIIEYELPEKRVLFPNAPVEAKFCCAKVEIDRRSPSPRRALRAARALQRGKTANTTTVVPEMSQQGPASAAAEGGPVTGETNVTVNQGDLLQIVLPGENDDGIQEIDSLVSFPPSLSVCVVCFCQVRWTVLASGGRSTRRPTCLSSMWPIVSGVCRSADRYD